ncbi:hypothetical protein C3942_06355 [Solimonas fluminis]|uniref:Alpha/beta hydrolase n=1 Tax=Solimonas fluminis TaxID=2086571 RepID=A0A2S5TJW0_9GAMM|nr:hypothetical protein [Solimonas fluminis]PPE75286.1 hypothetical protein C3942_06355 [Solimonas fluminis]
MKMSGKFRRRAAGGVLVLSAALAGCGSSSSLPEAPAENPVTGEARGCDAAAFPSAAWTLCEAQNIANTLQNTTLHTALLPGLLSDTTRYQVARLSLLLTDPERQPNPNSCTAIALCPIDPRVQGWEAAGELVAPVLYTSRSGATISGHVWATAAGPAKRPGVIIVNGSVVGYEPIYWYAAQTLARSGFVVMTFDAQGEGMSDQFGEAPDQLEAAFAGIPALGLVKPADVAGFGLGGNGLPFYDGGADALDFLLSTPTAPYVPVPSRSSGTSHAAKQERRVAAGLNAAYNPLWQLLDASRIGIAGHSYGAEAASWLVQQDSRLSAAVAWDALCVPVSPSPDEAIALATAPVNRLAGALPLPAGYGLPTECFGAPAGPAPAITKPALSITSDYLLVPAPYLAPPDPDIKAEASHIYSQQGVDTGTIVIRGGTHFDFNDVPAVLPASLRGIDLVAWYTAAWFSKYLKNDPGADALLLSRRWQDDSATAQADAAGDPNLLSWHYHSRLDIRLRGGGRFKCENLRLGCAGQVDAARDGGPERYSFAEVVGP